jgi:hypothetical protein
MEAIMARLMVLPDPPRLPPDSFDPVHNLADRARLEEFWLPSMPDPNHEAVLYAHWAEMFSHPLHFVWAHSQPFLVRPFESSRNWSGAYLLPSDGRRYTRVVGRWQIPTVRLGTGPNPDALPFRCSIWIGLDGKKPWTKSMPQVGTEHTVDPDGAVEEPKVWWQWWLRDDVSEPHYISGVPIAAGDVVLCSLTVMSLNLVRFHVKNQSTGDFATLAHYEAEQLRGSSAEWIVERPADPAAASVGPRPGGEPEPGPLFPLPDYGVVTFERCATRAEVEPGSGVRYSLPWEPRLIRMVEIFPRPTRSVVISTPTHGQPPHIIKMRYRRPL